MDLKKKKLTQARLKELLTYNPETGIFTWKVSRGSRAVIGEKAVYKNRDGYIQIGIDGKQFRAHRLVWLYVHGYFPENGLDHKNRNPVDNRIKNLREASQQCNRRNSNISVLNTSGITGVYWEESRSKWRAAIYVDGIQIHRGLFTSKTDAAKARWEAEKEFNWPNCCTTSSAYLYLKERGK